MQFADMEFMQAEGISVDEIWDELQYFGVKREMFEFLDLSPEEVFDLYDSVKGRHDGWVKFQR